MIIALVLLLGSALAIYVACELFVNAIEWLGRKLGVSETATGTVLAAFGTALPESVVTLVATAFAVRATQKDVGVGAALGGPLALGTIAYAVTGIVLLASLRKLGRAGGIVQVDQRRLARDQLWFLIIFLFKVALGLAAFAAKPWAGFLFLAAYGWYFRSEMLEAADTEHEELEPLKFQRKAADPHVGWVIAQTTLALVVIFIASHVFVGQLETIGPYIGLSPQTTALLLSPVATELPEIMNAIIWVRQGKERLALANISGAMMIQATVPTAFGLFFTPWLLGPSLLLAAAVTIVAISMLFVVFHRGRVTGFILAQAGWLYVVFAVLLALISART